MNNISSVSISCFEYAIGNGIREDTDRTMRTLDGVDKGSHVSPVSPLLSEESKWIPSMMRTTLPLLAACSRKLGSSQLSLSSRWGTSRVSLKWCFNSFISLLNIASTRVDSRVHPTACQKTYSLVEVLPRLLLFLRETQLASRDDAPTPNSPRRSKGALSSLVTLQKLSNSALR